MNAIMGIFVLTPFYLYNYINPNFTVTSISKYTLMDCLCLIYMSFTDVASLSLFTFAFRFEKGERLLPITYLIIPLGFAADITIFQTTFTG